jgi:hypothetical protein
MAACSGITDKQKETVKELTAKKEAGKITKLQEDELNRLINKRDNPELPEGAKTYCEQWVKEQIYERKKDFSSKYTAKGNSVEDDAINLLAEYYDWGLVYKNEKHFSNDFIEGTPDLVLSDLIPDNKASWDCFTFPLFQTKLDNCYWWQMQGYMDLTGKSKAAVIYTLMDAPEDIVDREARSRAYQAGFDEVDMDFYENVKLEMTYSHLPLQLRIKRFDIERNDKAIQQIKDRVVMCREYIKSLDLFNLLLSNNLKAA